MPTDNPQPQLPDAQGAGPVPAKKPRKKRGPNKPKQKPVEKPVPDTQTVFGVVVDPAPLPDTPVQISDDDPALQTKPDPSIDALAAARQVLLARATAEADEATAKVAAARQLVDENDANQAPKNVQIREVGMKLSDLQKRLDEARNRVEPVRTPAKPTDRQQATIDAEMAAGKRRVAHFTAQDAARTQQPPDPNEPINTPVFRPADFVPDINSKDPALGSQDLK